MGSFINTLAISGTLAFLTSRFIPQLSFSATATFWVLTFLLSAAVFTYKVILWPFVFSPIRHLPGPKSESWFMGEFMKVMRMPSGDPQKEYLKIPNSGLIRYLTFWNAERIMPTNARMLQQALSTDADIWVKPGLLRGGLAIVLGTRGVLFAEGNEHKAQRRILNPAFSRRQIRNLVPVFWDKAVVMGKKVADDAKTGGLVNMSRWSSLATLDIIGAAGLGYDFGSMEKGENGNELARAYATLFAPTRVANILRFVGLFVPDWVIYWLPVKRSRDVRAAHGSIKAVCKELIRSKRMELRERKSSGEERDILSTLINSGEYNTVDGEDVIRDQLMTFLAAGHETTATLTVWAIHLLTLYPQYQQILRDEVRNAFPRCPETVTYEQLEGLKYLHNFAQEVMRFYPPVALTMRENNKDTTLDGVFIPKGTTMVIVPWALHKDTKVWGKDADEFRPERWERAPMESNYSLLTFLAGPRNCIGKDFAKSEFKALLAVLVGRFKFEATGEDLEIQGGITNRPKGGLKVKVEEVGGW